MDGVVIRTNGEGTSLTVNAALDTVHHYDYLDELTVTAVDPDNSYHEHGTVRTKATISSGHFVVEEGAVVPQVEVKDVQSENTVKVTAKEETIISVDASSANKTTVVVESENVYATGLDQASISGSQASSVELPTVVTNEEELTTAIANNTAYIQLGASFEAANTHVFTYKAVVDFSGYTISATTLKQSLLINNSKLTIADTSSEGNGGVTSVNNNIIMNNSEMVINNGSLSGNRALTTDEAAEEGRSTCGVIHISTNAKLTINYANVFTATDFAVLNEGTTTTNDGVFTSESESRNGLQYGYCVSSYSGDITLNGGYFKSYRMEAASIGNNADGVLGRLATAVINGGTFINGAGYDTKPAIKIINPDWTTSSNYGIGEATIYDGKFSSDVTGANGVDTCVKDSDGLWVVNQ